MQDLLRLTDRELYQLIADEVVAGSGSFNDDQRGFFGKAWFEAQSERLRDQICGSSLAASSGSDADRASAILALLDSFGGDLGLGHAPAVVAVAILIARIGLDNFCRNSQPPKKLP